MIDLTKLTSEQANKLEMALLQLTPNIEDKIHCYDRLGEDPDFSPKTRLTMKSNADWWREVLQLINK